MPKKSKAERVATKRFAEGMRAAGRLAYQLLDELEGIIEPGISTLYIDEQIDLFTSEAGATSAPYNYGNFPGHCCTSLNDVICHGIPSVDDVLKEGDILNVDVTPILRGYHGDSSRMFMVGKVSPEAEKLVEIAHQCLWKGIEAVSPNCTIDVVGQAIQPHAKEYGFSVVREYTGHGIGKTFHKDPPIPHAIMERGDGVVEWPVLRRGMAFTIEPMINVGGPDTMLMPDNWTVVTKDGKLSAQWEHTLLVTGQGIEVLTNGGQV